MKRLIDAEALKKDYPEDEDWEYPVNTNKYVVESIDRQPTVDAVPIDWLIEQEENVLNGDDFRDECAGVRLAWMAEAEREEE